MFSFRVPLRAKGSNRVLKKSFSCFDRLSTNGKSPTIAMPAPFALSLSKGERGFFSSLLGDLVQQDGDVFGEGVTIATRLQTLATPDTIHFRVSSSLVCQRESP